MTDPDAILTVEDADFKYTVEYEKPFKNEKEKDLELERLEKIMKGNNE